MSSWRLPRPVVGAKRIRRGSSVGGSKPLAPHQSLFQPHITPYFSAKNHATDSTREISLSLSLKSQHSRTRDDLVTSRQGPRTSQRKGSIMSAAAGEGKEKGACELCGAAARVYCGADEATLCWGCDAQVHGANFLVARHARTLLCRGCARPTPWRAAGPRLGPTASLCARCLRRGGGGDVEMAGEGGGGGHDGEEEEEDDDDDEEAVVVEEEDEEEGEGENQVVPWAEEAEATPPPVASSTSSSSREAAAANGANAVECAEEDIRWSNSAFHGGRSDVATSSSRNGGRFLASRHRKRSPSDFLGSGSAQSGSATLSRNCSNAGIGRNG